MHTQMFTETLECSMSYRKEIIWPRQPQERNLKKIIKTFQEFGVLQLFIIILPEHKSRRAPEMSLSLFLLFLYCDCIGQFVSFIYENKDTVCGTAC